MTGSLDDFLTRVVPEINHLFWTKVFINQGVNKGMLDWGWSCREHAWAVSLLVGDLDIDSMVAHGKLELLLPPLTSQSQPVVIAVKTHAFVWLTRYGYLDVSMKPKVKVDLESALEFPRLISSRLVPESWGDLEICPIGKALSPLNPAILRPRRLARYKVERLEEPNRRMTQDPCAWINSPLTDKLRHRYGGGAYGAALLHPPPSTERFWTACRTRRLLTPRSGRIRRGSTRRSGRRRRSRG
jgi:hypothetical protein